MKKVPLPESFRGGCSFGTGWASSPVFVRCTVVYYVGSGKRFCPAQIETNQSSLWIPLGPVLKGAFLRTSKEKVVVYNGKMGGQKFFSFLWKKALATRRG